jgi:hypothetical protein
MAQAPPLAVPPFRGAVSGSYRMRHLHASASSQETGPDADPIHLHTHQGRRTRLPVLRPGHDHGLWRLPAAARGCPRHAVAALDGIAGAQVDWGDSKGLNEWERKALELTDERNRLG